MEMMEAWFILGDIKPFFWEMLWAKQTQSLLTKKRKKKKKASIIV